MAHVLAKSGYIDKAIAAADKIDLTPFDNAHYWAHLGRIYHITNDSMVEKARNAYLKAESLYESSAFIYVDNLLSVYGELATITSRLDGDTRKAIAYCAKAWKLASKVGFDKVDLLILFDICNFGNENDHFDKFPNWLQKALFVTGKMLELGVYEELGAYHYVVFSLTIFPHFVKDNAEYKPVHAEKCLSLLEQRLDADSLALAGAQWLVGLAISQNGTWPSDSPSTRRAVKMLKKSVNCFQLKTPGARTINASARGLIADAYFAKGDYALAASEYERAKTLISGLYNNNSLISHFSKRLDLARKKMKG
jgi:tetratricopeptide (TPR) repeat protein